MMADWSTVARCYLCAACTASCPISEQMDYGPHLLVSMARIGLEREALSSRSIWLCMSCGTCVTRCPNRVDLVAFFEALRRKSLAAGLAKGAPEVAAFHRAFLRGIRRRGRVNELKLVLGYGLSIAGRRAFRRFVTDLKRGVAMLLKGRFTSTNTREGPRHVMSRLLRSTDVRL